MLKTTLEEAVNGWIITIEINGDTKRFIYERLEDAQSFVGDQESKYECGGRHERHPSKV